MKVTKDVGRQANLLEGKKWAHWTNKKFRNKKNPNNFTEKPNAHF